MTRENLCKELPAFSEEMKGKEGQTIRIQVPCTCNSHHLLIIILIPALL